MRNVLVKDIMSSPLVSLELNSSIRDVSKLMMMKGVGSVLVRQGQSYRGIITKKDIVWAVANGKDASKVLAKEIMTSHLKSVDVGDTVFDAAKILVKEDIRRIVVTKKGVPVGMVSDKDIVRVAPDIVELLVENAKRGI